MHAVSCVCGLKVFKPFIPPNHRTHIVSFVQLHFVTVSFLYSRWHTAPCTKQCISNCLVSRYRGFIDSFKAASLQCMFSHLETRPNSVIPVYCTQKVRCSGRSTLHTTASLVRRATTTTLAAIMGSHVTHNTVANHIPRESAQ